MALLAWHLHVFFYDATTLSRIRFGESLAYRRSSDALVKFGPGKANACDPDNIIQGNVNTIPLWARFSLAADPAGQTAR